MKQKGKLVLLSISSLVLTIILVGYGLFFPGIPFLIAYMDPDNHEDTYLTKEIKIHSKGRVVAARLYSPNSVSAAASQGTILLVHGVHSDGYNEKRLIHFASSLIQLGYQVVTPDIEDLKQFQIVERAVLDIEIATRWLLHNSKIVASNEKIGLWGISFAGGLCLSLAGTETYKNRISSTFSFGGHGNLDTTLEYLMTGNTPSGKFPPHVYGQAVLVRRFAALLVPKDQQPQLKATILNYLQGNYSAAKKQSQLLPNESRKLTRLIFTSDVRTLGKILTKKIGPQKTPARLSAIKGQPPICAIHLLHGSGDNVIPPNESQKLLQWASQENREVHMLISPLINHVELEKGEDQKQYTEYLKIIQFWTELLRNT